MATEKLSVILELLAGQYKKEVKDAASDTDRLTASLGKTGQMASRIGGQLTTSLTLPLAALAVGAVKAASDLAESMNAINVVFKEAAGTVEAFGETAAESAGLSQRAFNEAVIPIGQLLNNFGLTADASADAVLALTQRAADLGSVLNVDTSVALEKFQAGLAGEAEPLKAFGVDVSVAAIKAEALALGLIRSGEEMSKSARAQAALSIIMRETAFAAGDFANTLETSLPNQLKQLKADAENVAAALGTAMLPSLLDVVKGVQGLVDRFTDLSVAQQEFVVKTGLTVAAIGPAVFVAGKLITAYIKLRAAILAANAAMAIRGVQVLARGGVGLPPPVPLGGAAAGGAAAGLSRLAGVLGIVTGAAWLTAEALRAILDIENEIEATTHIQERAWSTRDAQIRNYEAGLKDVTKSATAVMLAAQAQEAAFAIRDLEVATGRTSTSNSDFIRSLDDERGALDHTTRSVDGLRLAEMRLADERIANLSPALAALRAVQDAAEAQQALTDAQDEGKVTQSELTQLQLEAAIAIEVAKIKVAEFAVTGSEGMAAFATATGLGIDAARMLAFELEALTAKEWRVQIFADYKTNAAALAAAGAAAGNTDFLKDLNAKAFGGPVMSGRPYMVGEEGPELFIPGQNGMVIPNNQLSSSDPGMVLGGDMGMVMASSFMSAPTYVTKYGPSITLQAPMGVTRQDLQYAAILASVTNLVEGL